MTTPAPAPSRLSDFLTIEERGGSGRCTWLRGRFQSSTAAVFTGAAAFVAEAAMRWRCRGAAEIFDLWLGAVESSGTLGTAERRRVAPFVQTAFGLPERPLPADQVQGHVAECVWYILAGEQVPSGRELLAREGPSFAVTGPGGDGLAVYRTDGDALIFRLWEIKKHGGTSSLSGTIGRAYGQLLDRADVYLAELTAEADRYSEPVASLYAELVQLWQDADPSAGAGVAVSTSASHLPRRCFGTMHTKFPGLGASQVEGLVVALGEFPAFAAAVRDRVWSAL